MVAVSIVSCSSCAKKIPNPTVVDAQPPIVDASDDIFVESAPTNVWSLGNFQITVPNADWQPQALDPHIFKVPGSLPLLNSALQNAIVLVREETTDSYDSYIINSVRGARESGATVTSTKQVTVNGHKFVLVESNQSGILMFAWVTLEKGVGYALSCGGPGPANQQDLCNGIANTLQIN